MSFMVPTSVAFVLISIALTEFCAEFESFSQDLTEMLLTHSIQVIRSLIETSRPEMGVLSLLHTARF